MATRLSTTLLPTNASNAIRDWAQFIEDTLVTTGGWVVTSDTGQTAPASLATPGGVNTKAGYRIYRMADALQSTYPVFMRIDYGSGASSANNPGFWVTIGGSTNGAGIITNKYFDGGAATISTVNINTAIASLTNNSYGSASTSRVGVAMWIQSSNAYWMMFTLERTKDSNGADTGDGLLLTCSDVSTTGVNGYLHFSRYVIATPGAQPSVENLTYIITRQNPSETFGAGDIGVGVLIFFKGVAQQPGTMVVVTNSSDVSAEGNFSLVLYGATRTYQNVRLLGYKTVAGGAVADGNVRINMRYD